MVHRSSVNDIKNLYAEFVVDTSGRNSETPKWLEEMGLGRPKETRVNSYIGYSTRRFKIPTSVASQHFLSDWKVMVIFTKPPTNPRMGIIYPIEGNNWLATRHVFLQHLDYGDYE